MENIRDVVAACEAADVKVVTPVVELRPGVTIAIVRDPDEASSNSFRWAEHNHATRERGQKSQPAGRSDERLDRKQVTGHPCRWKRVTQLRHRTASIWRMRSCG